MSTSEKAKLNLSKKQTEYIRDAEPFLWINPSYGSEATTFADVGLIFDADARLRRFSPVLISLFPELKETNGLIESTLDEVPLLRGELLLGELSQGEEVFEKLNQAGGRLFIKGDHNLPVAGSIKARGGIHEVLHFAESLALKVGIIESTNSDYHAFLSEPAKSVFAQYTIAVGSTGNLGLSIGIIGAALGFNAVVHMSSDVKKWKKDRLRKRGVQVVEHTADYGAAVEAGRVQSEVDPYSYFVDDERSSHLFMGYAVAALRLKEQLENAEISVDKDHPLFVYLPAGVGGAPGGITFGLKSVFGDHVHCFFAEPVQAPCMLLGMAGQPNSAPTPVYDFGLSIDTDADGLAVGTASQWVCDVTRHMVSGVYTQRDATLYRDLERLKRLENIEVEPSAAISCSGIEMLNTDVGQEYLINQGLLDKMENSTHIAWLTGGSFVPAEEYEKYLEQACI
ncbi:D-serine ammonia-lyase [Marinomonas mediterranea]|uniref:D-serine ammonia-lyase n=1 Tax=Marinomonas mediterranea TaxID=119864 RepID=UPI0023492F91|nr:D-serine ammonia-lyase [Marinomonas mediterranea]WCN11053.1 D-serine ammonia-lyase [Marinomonas mediterranea]